MPTGGAGALVLAGLAASVGADFMAGAIRQRRFTPQLRDAILRDINSNSRIKNDFLKEATPTNRKFLEEEFLKLPPAPEGAPRASIEQPINLPKRAGGGPEETTRPGAVRRSDSEPVPTEMQKAIQKDSDAIAQAFSEIDADLTGGTRTSIGDNLIHNAVGGYYRFNELPSWIPENLRDGALMAKVMDNINNNRKPRSNASNEIALQEVVEQRIKQRAEQIQNTDTEGVFSPNTPFAIALIGGGTYFVMSEDGQFLPVVAGMAVATNPLARGAASQQIRNHLRMLAKEIKTLEDKGVTSGAKYNQLIKAYDSAMVQKQKIETPR
jgi:hypothetical protein